MGRGDGEDGMARRRRKLEEQLAELNELCRSPDPEIIVEGLRSGLADHSSLVAAKAAVLAGEQEHDVLTPELVTAFEYFMESPVKRDPGCHAKSAITRALQLLDHPDADIFLRAAHHIQLEPV
jgi:hypothetical protein